MTKKATTKKNTGGIQWPPDLDPNEGWPTEATPFPGRPGRTYGDVAVELGTTVEAMCQRLGKPAAKLSKEGA